MAADPVKRIERSVDSLQKTYAVIVALALGQAIQHLLVDKTSGTLAAPGLIEGSFPAFVAFLFTVVPFYHGMNRHLDFCYVERPQQDQARGALLFDFFVFFMESSLLFAAAISVSPDLAAFLWLGVLLALDILWGFLSHWIHYRKLTPSIIRWGVINLVTVVIGFAVASTQVWPDNTKIWLLMLLAIMRTIVDYWKCWEFYFPPEQPPAAKA